MTELRCPIVAQLYVVIIGVQSDADAICGICLRLCCHEMAAVNQHALTPRPDRGDAAIFWLRDKAINHVKDQATARQHHRICSFLALEFNVLKVDFFSQGEYKIFDQNLN